MTFRREDKRGRLVARANDQLIERVEEFARTHGLSKSEVIRRSITAFLPDEGEDGPVDPEIREVYGWLEQWSDDRNRIVGKQALNELTQRLSMPKRFVKSGYLDPLKREGWIDTPQMGVIRVVPPQERNSDPTPTNEQ